MNGIHCRPSTHIYKAAVQFSSDLRAEGASGSANLKSMIEIITLALHCGDSVSITAEGDDEQAALDVMCAAFEEHYDYPD